MKLETTNKQIFVTRPNRYDFPANIAKKLVKNSLVVLFETLSQKKDRTNFRHVNGRKHLSKNNSVDSL